MKRWWKTGVIAGAGVFVTALFAMGIVSVRIGSGDSALAAPGDAPATPTLVAVAIGQLQEESGESFTVDLHAAIRDGVPGGALRFYGDEVGYYNGGVRTLSVEDGVIHVTGGGGLFKPDGTRAAVRYSAEFSLDGSHAAITVQGRDYTYTMEGTLDGFVHVFTPPAPAS